MTVSKWLVLSIASACCWLEACSSKPLSVDNDKTPVAKPKFDFGKVLVSPDSGKGKEATFHVSVSGGSQKPGFLGLLINSTKNGEHACYVMQNFVVNDTLLVNDSGVGTVSLGGQNSVANHQCEVVKDGTSSSVDSAGSRVTFHIRFLPEFDGVMHMWGVPSDNTMNGPEMVMIGGWNVQ